MTYSKDFTCEDCGSHHMLDTSIPSTVWNTVCENPGAARIGMKEATVLCTLCLDERLVKAGLTCDQAEFYFVGKALSSKLYEESHGDVARLERQLEQLRATAYVTHVPCGAIVETAVELGEYCAHLIPGEEDPSAAKRTVDFLVCVFCPVCKSAVEHGELEGGDEHYLVRKPE